MTSSRSQYDGRELHFICVIIYIQIYYIKLYVYVCRVIVSYIQVISLKLYSKHELQRNNLIQPRNTKIINRIKTFQTAHVQFSSHLREKASKA